jgi:hypothetical protein
MGPQTIWIRLGGWAVIEGSTEDYGASHLRKDHEITDEIRWYPEVLRLYTALRIPLNHMEQKGSVKGGYNLKPIFLYDRFEDCLLAKADGGWWELQTQPPRYDTRTL